MFFKLKVANSRGTEWIWEMMRVKQRRIFAVLFIVVGVLLFLTPGVLAPVCPPKADGGFMKCHWMGEAEKGIGAVIILLGMVFLLLRSSAAAYGLAIANFPVGALGFLLAFRLIGGCKMHSMSCNLYTCPLIGLLTGIYLAVSLLYLLLRRKHEPD